MTENLKRCPFCGSEAEIIGYDNGTYRCVCLNCVCAQDMFFDSPEESAEEWNARPIEDKLHEEINNLEAENTCLQRKLNESIDDNYKNAWKIQQQAERGAKFAQKENTRLREALELIAKSNFYFARGDEDKQLRRVCEIARNALNGNEK